MSTSAVDALAAVRSRLETGGSGITIPLRWQGEDGGPLPDTPAAFAFVVFNNDGAGGGPAAFGGGRGANLYRNRALVEAFVFAPNGEGLPVAMAYAETIAARMRSYRDTAISCFSADVVPVGEGSKITPPGLTSEVSLYMCAVAMIELTFDQIG